MESLQTEVRGLSKLLSLEHSPLFAILPHNNDEYATAAQEAGADSIVIGIDKTESMFPGLFGSFDLQEDSINSILSNSSIPVGISIGDSRPLTPESWERIVSKPFAYVNMYAHHMPPFVLEDDRMEKLLTIGAGYMLEQVKSMSEMESVSALEAAIVSPQGKNHVFSVLDLSTLRMIARLSNKPVILRAQKKLEPGDFRSVTTEGMKGITVDPSALEPGVEAYRDAISTYRSRTTRPAQTT
ncbi:MAG: hypothetical protein JRN09_06215 [Nitrososphaerota archaeon]|nr:hypothetical protein [Nitrososphaerota archaeon]